MSAINSNPGAGSPFDPDNHTAYRAWRDAKLDAWPGSVTDLKIAVSDPAALSANDITAITNTCQRCNLAIVTAESGPLPNRETVRQLGAALGLARLDHTLCADDSGITLLQVENEGERLDYIPYTDKPLNWHTDGYYNEPASTVRAFILLCVDDAPSGGNNALLDPEIAYMQLRDESPELITALMAPDVMTIPANTVGGTEQRPARSGPVFSVDAVSGALHMRYTARTRSIEWKQDSMTAAALEKLQAILSDSNKFILDYRLQPGEALVCNNVLHNRTGFENDMADEHRRKVFRARYLDRISNTGINPETYAC